MTQRAGAAAISSRQWARGLSLTICAVLVVVFVLQCFKRYFVNDDYLLLFTAWQRSLGRIPGRDLFVTSFSPMFDPFVLLFRWFPNSWAPAYLGRLAMVGCLVVCAWFCACLARRMFHATAALFAPVFFLASAPVLHRGIDLRPDPVSTALSLAMFLLCLARPAPTGRGAAALGALLGLALVNRFKTITTVPPLIALLAWQHYQQSGRRGLSALLRSLPTIAAGVATPAALCALYLHFNGTLGVFFSANLRLVSETEAIDSSTVGLRTATLTRWLVADPLLIIAFVCGLGISLSKRSFQLAGVLALSTAGFLSIVANPAYYSYNLLTLAAFAAPIAAGGVAHLLDLARRTSASLAWALTSLALIAMPLVHGPYLVHYACDDSAKHQRDFATFLLEYTSPETNVFAMEGVGLFRPSNYHWRLPQVLLSRYQRGEWRMQDEWNLAPPAIVVTSYRVPNWLTGADRRWISDRYVPLTKHLLVPGHHTGGEVTNEHFQIVTEGPFQIDEPSSCQVDGVDRVTGSPFFLAAGWHSMTSFQACTLIRYYPPAAIALVANPRNLEYLMSPELSSIAPVIAW